VPEALGSIVVTHQLVGCRSSNEKLEQAVLPDGLKTVYCSQRPSNFERLTGLFHAFQYSLPGALDSVVVTHQLGGCRSSLRSLRKTSGPLGTMRSVAQTVETLAVSS
jgi:hypothetical protein